MIFGLNPIIKGQRGTHPGGVGSEGIATIVSDPKFPACEFFTPGHFYPVCLRHSTSQSIDDAEIDIFGGALRFAGSEDEESPLDLVLGTGEMTPLWSTFSSYGGCDRSSFRRFENLPSTKPRSVSNKKHISVL